MIIQSSHEMEPRPGFIKQFKIKWDFLQLFPVFRKVVLHTIMNNSAKGGLKSIVNTLLVQKNPLQQREQLHKISPNLKLLYATGIWAC